MSASRPPPPGRTRSASRVLGPNVSRRTSISAGGPKTQRTSKTSEKLVVLPSLPQTKTLHADPNEEPRHGETDGVRELKSEAERMSKEQRKKAGYKRLTVYCISEAFKMKNLASFLKREHNVLPRVFDEALYAMYHLPLLPGYGTNVNVRSSPAAKSAGKSMLSRLSEAEDDGYQDTYFTAPVARSPTSLQDGYITSSSPVETRKHRPAGPIEPETPASEVEHFLSDADDTDTHWEPQARSSVPKVHESEQFTSEADDTDTGTPHVHWEQPLPEMKPQIPEEQVAEIIFFEYGVVVFFGLEEEAQEQSIIQDLENANVVQGKISEADWEIEECHFAHNPHIAYPRIYNDFFTLKSTSHLLKISIAHALAQSTLLAHYETNAQRVLSSPHTLSIPKQLATTGSLQLKRIDALKLTGRLFKLRRDVNLVSNVLDTPELFWSESSLKQLYDAVREYMEISSRVEVLNHRLMLASEFLDAIHDHLNNSAMERITWIVIWLIVAAIVVDLGEVLARLIFHAGFESAAKLAATPMTREEALRTLERLMI